MFRPNHQLSVRCRGIRRSLRRHRTWFVPKAHGSRCQSRSAVVETPRFSVASSSSFSSSEPPACRQWADTTRDAQILRTQQMPVVRDRCLFHAARDLLACRPFLVAHCTARKAAGNVEPTTMSPAPILARGEVGRPLLGSSNSFLTNPFSGRNLEHAGADLGHEIRSAGLIASCVAKTRRLISVCLSSANLPKWRRNSKPQEKAFRAARSSRKGRAARKFDMCSTRRALLLAEVISPSLLPDQVG